MIVVCARWKTKENLSRLIRWLLGVLMCQCLPQFRVGPESPDPDSYRDYRDREESLLLNPGLQKRKPRPGR